MKPENEKVAPKFRTVFLAPDFQFDGRLDELKRWCSKFIEKGLMPSYGEGCFGNLSYRMEGNKFIITASGLKEPGKNDSFVEVESVDLGKFTVYARGRRDPSSESVFHYLIYKDRKDVNAIFHGHCEKLLASADKLGVPITLRDAPYGTRELADSILEVLGRNFFVIIRNHGFVSLGRDLDDAGERALKML